MQGSLISTNSRSVYLLWLAALLLVAAWLIPDHYPPWASFYNEFAAFAALWVLLLHCAIGAAYWPVRFPREFLIIAAVAAIPLAQIALGYIYFSGDGWIAAAYLIGLACSCSVGYLLVKRGGFAWLCTGLAWVLLAGATLSAMLVMHQWLDLDYLGYWVDDVPHGRRPYANLAQPNLLATLLCLGVAALIYLWQSGRIKRSIACACVLLLIMGIVLTQSRTPWLAAMFLAVWWLVKRHSVPGIKGWAIGLGLALYAGLIILWPLDKATPLTPRTAQRGDIIQAGAHFENWQEMLRAIGKEPLLGYGWNQVSAAHTLTAKNYPLPELLSHSHNLLLDLVIWNGLPLGLLIIAGIAWWLATRAWRCRTPESWFALLSIGFVGVHAMFEYPFDYAYFLLPIGLLIGVIEADQNMSVRLRIPTAVLWLMVVISACFMGLVWHEYRIVEDDYRLMRFETRNIGPLKAGQAAPDLVLLTQLREDLRMARTLARENMSEDELAWMQKVTYRYPYYSNLFRYSLSLALNDQRQEASVAFRRLYDLYGDDPYENARNAVKILADTQYPSLKDWELPNIR